MFDQIWAMDNATIDIPITGEKRDTLTIRIRTRKDGRSTYQARRLIPPGLRTNPRNPYITKSLNTLDLDVAKSSAVKWERGLFAKINSGKPLKALPFDKMALEYLDKLGARANLLDQNGRPLVAKSALKRARTAINRYLIPFFADLDVTEIRNSHCRRYLVWRQDYYVDGPGATENTIYFERAGAKMSRPSQKNKSPARSTIAKDSVTFNGVIKYVADKHDLLAENFPKIDLPKTVSHRENRRPRFTDGQLELLFQTHENRQRKSDDRSLFFSKMLSGLMELLLGTGIRVSEAMWLQVKHLQYVDIDPRETRYFQLWSDYVVRDDDQKFIEPEFTEEDRKQFRVRIAKDNQGLKRIDQNRTVIPTKYFTEMFRTHMEFLKSHYEYYHNVKLDTYWDLPPEHFLFINQKCERVASLGNGFDTLLNAAVSEKYPSGLKVIEGESFSLSCFRPTYASKQIEAGATANGVTLLADNMGTSPDMIWKHYGQLINEQHAKELQKV